MATDKTVQDARHRREVADALVRAMRAEGLTQDALGKILGASQPTVSKLLNGHGNPRPNLARTVEAFLSERGLRVRPAGVDAVVRAYASSEVFRRLCDAALEIMNDKE